MARRRIYHLRGEPFAATGDGLDAFEELWEARLDSLEAFLSAMEDLTEHGDR